MVLVPVLPVSCIVGNQLGYLQCWKLAGSSHNHKKGYTIEGRTVKQSAGTVK